MCGIFALLNNQNCPINIINMEFLKGQSRGPEYSELFSIKNIHSFIGFHRLAINGYQEKKSNQPFFIDGIYLVCNGEIYNHKHLRKILNVKQKSRSDCEIIIHLYKKYGIESVLQNIDGVFAFVLIDTIKKKIYVARDPYGVRPLFISSFNHYTSGKKEDALIRTQGKQITTYGIASELKSIVEIGKNYHQKIQQFEPGCFATFKYSIDKQGENMFTPIEYVTTTCYSMPVKFPSLYLTNYDNILSNVFDTLRSAVKKRVQNTEREVACLLSGGLDSSIIAAMVKSMHPGDLHTWSIGFKGSEDLKYAQMVANHIGTIHHSIEVDEQEFIDAIPEVIYHIESYDTTTVRASVGNWLICKKIKEQSDAKVIFNGDGADEVMGGYLYFHKAPDCIAFDKECRRLLSDIHYFDVLRSDRSISSHGLEARTPFLDRTFVDSYLSISPQIRCHASNNKPEKYIIREAIAKFAPNLLPKSVLHRTKEAFSDGVSKQTRSWYEIIQEYVKTQFSHIDTTESDILYSFNPYIYNAPKTLEQLYYRDLFCKHFPTLGCDKTIPYFWMPKFVKNATDASARTLDIYNKKMKSN